MIPALSVALTFLIAVAIGVVGYSVAKPLLQYDGKVQPDLSVAETAQPATTAIPVATQTETVPATEAPTEAAACESGVRLSAEALQSADALQQALAKARSDSPNGKLLVIPLKVQGGAVLYQTNVETAKQCGAAQGNLTLPQITAAAMEQGWTPVAECSLLYDNLLPKFRVEAGYQTADGSQWLDNSADNGGKPWASPLSTVTLQYLTELTQEIAASDFSQIWFADAVFPPFRDSDLAYIGSSVEAENAGLECNSSCNRCCLLPRGSRFPWKSVQPKPRTALQRRLRRSSSPPFPAMSSVWTAGTIPQKSSRNGQLLRCKGKPYGSWEMIQQKSAAKTTGFSRRVRSQMKHNTITSKIEE